MKVGSSTKERTDGGRGTRWGGDNGSGEREIWAVVARRRGRSCDSFHARCVSLQWLACASALGH
eukprot:385953-Prymnesium_polylepis.1